MSVAWWLHISMGIVGVKIAADHNESGQEMVGMSSNSGVLFLFGDQCILF
jgi:hypothetical protein